jgi:isocitrate/isopropylmalate dehydrogenase
MARHRIAAIAGDGIGTEVEPATMVDVVIAHSFGRPAVKDQMSRGLSDPTST